ncbi:sodium/proton antiporter, CPA1 family [Rhizobiales bacterium GAS188]|nr:sodium/proton antiporter, CPA1 family [Rhizobiales bacterium GAS188]
MSERADASGSAVALAASREPGADDAGPDARGHPIAGIVTGAAGSLSTFDLGSIVFLFAATVGFLNDRHFHLPRAIALLIGALLASLVIIVVGALVTPIDIAQLAQRRIEGAHLPRILLDGVLALLLFAASLHVDLRELRSQAWVVFGLATAGVVLATVVFAYGIWAVFKLAGMQVPLAWCFVLGAIVAPTDAVAVEGLLERVRLPSALKGMISGESLFNDGTAVVLFFAAVAAAEGEVGVAGHGRILLSLLKEGALGGALGVATGYLARQAIRHVKDDNLTLTISVALALSTYRLALALGLSGPIAVVVCGIVLTSRPLEANGRDERRQKLATFWSLVDELLNTLLFLLMGFEILAIDGSVAALVPIIVAIPLALAARLLSVCALMPLLPLGWDEKRRAIAVLTWVGLRGGISVALVLNLPETQYRDALSAVCYGVVIFTIVVQGLLTPRIIGWLYRSHDGT